MPHKLIPCEKPKNLDETYVGQTITVFGRTFVGRYDLDGNLYEQDVDTDEWFKLEEIE